MVIIMTFTNNGIIYAIAALICSILLAYSFTPIVRVLAYKIGAIDVPKDNRRMHKKPTPRIGGLAIFLGFLITCLFFCEYRKELFLLLGGALLIVILGIFDDVFSLNAFVKLICQLAISAIPVIGGIRIDYIHLGEKNIEMGIWSIPVTILWITALTNAINIIDGLDGLSCGVSTISAISIFFVVILQGEDIYYALVALILIGSCFGFIPFNRNPARIFMGDTGALFLGYTLSLISVEGMFKMHTAISMIVPLIIFALPLADTLTSIVRRVLTGRNPFSADREHIHHKLIDMGFTQKETVSLLYSICGILGLVAVFMCGNMFSEFNLTRSIIITIIAVAIFVIYMAIFKNPESRLHTGLLDESFGTIPKVEQKTEEKAEENKSNEM